MKNYNLIAVFDSSGENLLMCRRRHDPYKGLMNFVGGKIEENENGMDAAYRELEEETSISRNDIFLHHVMDLTYYYEDCRVEVYAGKLNKAVEVYGDENDLCWQPADSDFFNHDLYAGEGNIGHIVERIKLCRIFEFSKC